MSCSTVTDVFFGGALRAPAFLAATRTAALARLRVFRYFTALIRLSETLIPAVSSPLWISLVAAPGWRFKKSRIDWVPVMAPGGIEPLAAETFRCDLALF